MLVYGVWVAFCLLKQFAFQTGQVNRKSLYRRAKEHAGRSGGQKKVWVQTLCYGTFATALHSCNTY